jgi:hypothetical protein
LNGFDGIELWGNLQWKSFSDPLVFFSFVAITSQVSVVFQQISESG